MTSIVASFAPGNETILLKLADFSFMMSLGAMCSGYRLCTSGKGGVGGGG